MISSSSLIELTKALNKFQGAMKSVPKSSVNPFFHSKYADLDAVWDACRKPLMENGLALVQTTDVTEGKLFLITTLFHISGEYITSRYPLIPMKQVQGQGWTLSEDPQSLGSAITYARRYAMCALLGVSAEEDDDGEHATHGKPRVVASIQKPPSIPKTPAEATQGQDSKTTSPPQPEKPAPSQEVKLGKAELLVAIKGQREELGLSKADLAVRITQRFPPQAGKAPDSLTQEDLGPIYEDLYKESQAKAQKALEEERKVE